MITHPRGPFAPGDQVQLTDPKGRQHRLVLVPGRSFHTHRGALAHDDLIGQPEGSLVTSAGGTPYIAFRPLLADYSVSMVRGAAVVYPKDAAQIVGLADIFPGARVVEAGAGSGALSCWLLRAVGEHGSVTSFERRPDFAEIAAANVERYFGGPHPAWRLEIRELQPDGLSDVDRARAGHARAVGLRTGSSVDADTRRPASAVTLPRRRNSPGPSARSASTAISPSRPPGKRCSAAGMWTAWQCAPSTG